MYIHTPPHTHTHAHVNVYSSHIQECSLAVNELVDFAFTNRVIFFNEEDKKSVADLADKNLDVRHCNTLQHTATYCNTLRHTATYCNAQQRTATHCNALRHNCNTLLHTATHTATLCKTHCSTHCNTLQHYTLPQH